MPQTLTDLEGAVLDFARLTGRPRGRQEQAIRDLFDVSATRSHQQLLGLLGLPEALAYAPSKVKRLQRVRDRRARERALRILEHATH